MMTAGARVLGAFVLVLGISAVVHGAKIRGRTSLGREGGTPDKVTRGTEDRLTTFERRYKYFLRQYEEGAGSLRPTNADRSNVVDEFKTVDPTLLGEAGLGVMNRLAAQAYEFAAVIAAAKAEGGRDEDISYCTLNTEELSSKSFAELDATRALNAKFVEATVQLREDVDKYAARLREKADVDWSYEFVDSPMYRGILLEYLTRTTDPDMEQLVVQTMINRLVSPRQRLVWYLAMLSEVPAFTQDDMAERMAMDDIRSVRRAGSCPDGSSSCSFEAVGHLINRAQIVSTSIKSTPTPAESRGKRMAYAESCWLFTEKTAAGISTPGINRFSLSDLSDLSPAALEARLPDLSALKAPSLTVWEEMFSHGDMAQVFDILRVLYLETATCIMANQKRLASPVQPFRFNFHQAGGSLADENLAELCHDLEIMMTRLRVLIHIAVLFIDGNGGHESQYYDAELLELRLLAEYAGLRGEDWMGVVDEHGDELCYRLVALGFAGHSQVHSRDVWKDELSHLLELSQSVLHVCEDGSLGCDEGIVDLPTPCREVAKDITLKRKPLKEWNREFSEKLAAIEETRSSWQHFLLKRSLNLRGDVPSPAGSAAVIPSVLTKFGAGRVPDQTFRMIDKCIIHDQILRKHSPDEDTQVFRYYAQRALPAASTSEMIRSLVDIVRAKYQTHRLQDLKSFDHLIFDDVSNSNIYMNGLGNNREGRRGRKTTTNIGVSLEFFGDCREHANAVTSMFAYWQQRQMHQLAKDHFVRGKLRVDEFTGMAAYSETEDESKIRQPRAITSDDMDPFTRRVYNQEKDAGRRERIMDDARDRVRQRDEMEQFMEGFEEEALLEEMTDKLHSDVREIHGEFFIPGVVAEMYNVKHTAEGHGVLRRVEFDAGVPRLSDYEKDPWGRKNFWVCEGEEGRSRVIVQTKANDRVFSEDEQRACVLYVLAEEHTFTILVHRNSKVAKYPTYLWDNLDAMSFEYADSFYSHVHDSVGVKNAFSTAGLDGRLKTALEMMDGFEAEGGRAKGPHEKSPLSLGYTGSNRIEPFCEDPSHCHADEGYSVRSLFRANSKQFVDPESGETVSMPVYWRPTDFSGKVYSQADNEFEAYRPMDIGLEVANFKPTFTPGDQQAMREYQAGLLFWYCSARVGTEEECFTSKAASPELRGLFGGGGEATTAGNDED